MLRYLLLDIFIKIKGNKLMAITSVTFQYPVAKVADSPWNTIINGLNYTKTNLAPVPLKNAESYHSTNGMSLPQSAYCAIPVVTSNPTSRSYTWMGEEAPVTIMKPIFG